MARRGSNRFSKTRLTNRAENSASVLAPGQNFTKFEREAVKLKFIEAYRKHGLRWPACQEAGVSPKTIINWRRADPDFDEVLSYVHEEWNDKIRAEIYKRAIEGSQEEVVSNGRVLTVTKRSDILLMFLAKSRMPEFRENGAIAEGGQSDSDSTEDRVEGRIAEMAKRLREAARVESTLSSVPPPVDRIGPNPLVDLSSLRTDQPLPSAEAVPSDTIDLPYTVVSPSPDGNPPSPDPSSGPPSPDGNPPSLASVVERLMAPPPSLTETLRSALLDD